MMTGNSRTADKFVVRLPDGMRDRVSEQAASTYISMNSWIVQAIEEKLQRASRKQLLLDQAIRAAQDLWREKAHNSVQEGSDKRAAELELLIKELSAYRKQQGGEA